MRTYVEDVVAEAKKKAAEATAEFLTKHGDRDLCGFAWVEIVGVKGSTKLGKLLLKNGFKKSYSGGLDMWNPSGNYTQAVTAKEVGAKAAADVLARMLNVKAYAQSRLD